jgi:hypothetical protein
MKRTLLVIAKPARPATVKEHLNGKIYNCLVREISI